MEQQEKLQYQAIVHKMLGAMVQLKGSDLFLTAGFPPAIKLNGKLTKLNENPVTAEQTSKMARAIASEKQWQSYIDTKGQNFAISLEGVGRFRINIFTQQQRTGMVIRTITTEIPDFDKMNLPPVLKTIVLEKRGLILLVGGTGSGKSTTLAAMLGVRNQETHGHIITIEDPVEFVHPHKNCVITQREVGLDTDSWEAALKNSLRQAPDVILMGEIRDRETMEHAIAFAETGHLCMATLHANSANQAIDRIVNFFPIEKHEQVRNDLALNMRAIISQRLVRKMSGGRAAAIETFQRFLGVIRPQRSAAFIPFAGLLLVGHERVLLVHQAHRHDRLRVALPRRALHHHQAGIGLQRIAILTIGHLRAQPELRLGDTLVGCRLHVLEACLLLREIL